MPVCELRADGKYKLVSAELPPMAPGTKFKARLPQCRHTAVLTWPNEVKAVFVFALPQGCHKCRKAAAGGAA